MDLERRRKSSRDIVRKHSKLGGESLISRDTRETVLESLEKIFSEIIERGYSSIYIVSHPSADLDSIASAIAIAHVLKAYSVNLCFITSGGLDPLASRVFEKVASSGILGECGNEIKSRSVLFVVDASSCERCEIDCELFNRVYIIDHHLTSETRRESENIRYIVDPEASSTTEILLRFILRKNILPRDRELLDIFLSAILYDTSYLDNTSQETEEIVRRLILEGASLSNSIKLLKRELRYDERIARIKTMLRVRVFESRDRVIVCISRVRAHEALAASLLMSAGCDIAIILSERDNEIRIVGRCGSLCERDSGLNKILFNDLVSRLGGEWGGHEKAGVARVSGVDRESVVKEIIDILSSRLGFLREIERE
ncbi:MAG: DHH family phosphoesterase [Sulfolobales archaeon]